MSEVAKIQRNFQITLPASVRKKAHIQVGDLVEIEAHEDGILMRPVTTVDKSQAWFWSKQWQDEEKRVEEDFKKGRIKKSKNIDEFLEELDK